MLTEPQLTEARAKLIIFLRSVHTFLESLASDNDPSGGRLRLFPERWRPLIRGAWESFRQDFNVENVVQKIQSAPAESLERAGIYGAQLTFKLGVIDSLRERFESSGALALLERLLEAIDLMMESLIEALELGEAISELLNFLRLCIQESDQDGNAKQLALEGWWLLAFVVVLGILLLRAVVPVETGLLLILLLMLYVIIRSIWRHSKKR